MAVKRNTLASYLGKLNAYKKKIKPKEILDTIGEIGVETARNQYGGEAKNISAVRGDDSVEIIAKGEQLAYMEFGTGVSGRGTYEGDLPTERLEFESPKGVKQSTKGWQYNYRKEQGQTDKDWKGARANAQMFNTARELERELPSKIANKIKGE